MVTSAAVNPKPETRAAHRFCTKELKPLPRTFFACFGLVLQWV